MDPLIYAGLVNPRNGSGGGVTVDSELNETSENPVQNKVVTAVVNQVAHTLKNDILPALPPVVNAADDGKICEVVNGKWAKISMADSAVVQYINAYISEVLGGEY